MYRQPFLVIYCYVFAQFHTESEFLLMKWICSILGKNVLWIYCILEKRKMSLFNKCLKSKYGFDFFMLLKTHNDILQFETENNSFHTNSLLGKKMPFFSI